MSQKLEKSKIESLAAEEEYLNEIKKNLNIYSPNDGFISKIFIHPSSFVTEGKTILILSDIDQDQLTFNIKIKDKNKILKKDFLDVKIDAYPNLVFQAKIDSQKNDIINKSLLVVNAKLFQIKNNGNESFVQLRPYMKARIKI